MTIFLTIPPYKVVHHYTKKWSSHTKNNFKSIFSDANVKANIENKSFQSNSIEWKKIMMLSMSMSIHPTKRGLKDAKFICLSSHSNLNVKSFKLSIYLLKNLIIELQFVHLHTFYLASAFRRHLSSIIEEKKNVKSIKMSCECVYAKRGETVCGTMRVNSSMSINFNIFFSFSFCKLSIPTFKSQMITN